jgi:hypothetical protein
VKHLFTYFAASLLLSATTATAQTTFRLGVRGGLNRALITQDAASNYSQLQSNTQTNYSAYKSAIYAWQAGAVLDVSFGKISLQPALIFLRKAKLCARLRMQNRLSITTTTTSSKRLPTAPTGWSYR